MLTFNLGSHGFYLTHSSNFGMRYEWTDKSVTMVPISILSIKRRERRKEALEGIETREEISVENWLGLYIICKIVRTTEETSKNVSNTEMLQIFCRK